MRYRVNVRWVLFAALGALLPQICALAADVAVVNFNDAEYRDKVYACWLGKNIGGTLGVPFEGQQVPHEITFYTNLKPGEPAANDDLDLQMLWLKAMEENDGRVDARILGEYWLKFVPVDWNEYGVGKRNMRVGILPPLSGEYDNAKWKHSNGAWIRSEIWACLAPGCPALAAQMAREDACVDHGAAEGVLAEIFTASVESAAFVESDRDKLIEIGLSMIPNDCGVARAIRTAIEAKKEGKDWKGAREAVIATTEDTGWFQAPRNVAFTVIGWLYGDGDFGKSICIAINCGDDTDCTGATLGSIFGIIYGTKGIPAEWKEPIGEKINTVAISGYPAPADLNELTDKTVAMAKKVLAMNNAPTTISEKPTDLSKAGKLKLSDPHAAKLLWDLSPFKIVWNEKDVQITVDYVSDPLVVSDTPRVIRFALQNPTEEEKKYTVAMKDVPEGWKTNGLPAEPVKVKAKGVKTFDLSLTAPAVESKAYQMSFQVTGGEKLVTMPITLVARDSVGPDDLALSSKGAKATADGEYASEAGCTAEAIDGVIAAADDFANRWHSSLDTPHPHWIEVKLPKAEVVGRVVVRFADRAGFPVSFQGLVKPEGASELKPVFDVTENKEPATFRAEFEPVTTDTFRLVIRASANAQYPNAAQVSEIELYPPKK